MPPLALTLALMAASGCQSVRLAAAYDDAHDFKAFVRTPRPTVPGEDYRVGVPDTLIVTVLNDGGLTEHRVTLGPDGNLLLPGLDEPVAAVNRTPAAIASDLSDRLAARAAGPSAAGAGPRVTLAANVPMDSANFPANRGPHVAVRVEGFASQRVFVFGQVDRLGAQVFDGSNTLAGALAAARPGPRADLRRVLVLRPGPDADPHRRLVVEAERILTTGDATLDVRLNDGDLVFVPATTLGRVGLAFDQVFGRPRADDRLFVRPIPAIPDPPTQTVFAAAPSAADTPPPAAEKASAVLRADPPTPRVASLTAADSAVAPPPASPAFDVAAAATPAATPATPPATVSFEADTASLMTIAVEAPAGPELEARADDHVRFWAP